ncbi:MAG: hypothetical protein JWO92_2461 [Chitinophagaceae bacterium]|nr:hypothetical protein [Chitinophagaceae bacterium]MDB5223667.1 hypothetical protein [Chitinophagaceae bacterium]
MKIYAMIKKILPAIILLMIINSSCAPTRRSISIEEGWDLLGEQKVNFVRDKDIIEVHSTYKFTALRFKVEAHEVRLNGLKIYYQNGDKLEPALDDIIPADQYSKEIELSQDGKFITRIEFTYRTTGNILKGRANVLVFGKRYTGF